MVDIKTYTLILFFRGTNLKQTEDTESTKDAGNLNPDLVKPIKRLFFSRDSLVKLYTSEN
jgi:hypothetical protein